MFVLGSLVAYGVRPMIMRFCDQHAPTGRRWAGDHRAAAQAR
jgi:hypothetical protein